MFDFLDMNNEVKRMVGLPHHSSYSLPPPHRTPPPSSLLSNGFDEGPNPFLMGLWVDGTSGHAYGRTLGALLGVDLDEIEGPKQKPGWPPSERRLSL